MKKYEFTGETIGGVIEHEGDLSHDNSCWVADIVVVCGSTVVKGHVLVKGSVVMRENCESTLKEFEDCVKSSRKGTIYNSISIVVITIIVISAGYGFLTILDLFLSMFL